MFRLPATLLNASAAIFSVVARSPENHCLANWQSQAIIFLHSCGLTTPVFMNTPTTVRVDIWWVSGAKKYRKGELCILT